MTVAKIDKKSLAYQSALRVYAAAHQVAPEAVMPKDLGLNEVYVILLELLGGVSEDRQLVFEDSAMVVDLFLRTCGDGEEKSRDTEDKSQTRASLIHAIYDELKTDYNRCGWKDRLDEVIKMWGGHPRLASTHLLSRSIQLVDLWMARNG